MWLDGIIVSIVSIGFLVCCVVVVYQGWKTPMTLGHIVIGCGSLVVALVGIVAVLFQLLSVLFSWS